MTLLSYRRKARKAVACCHGYLYLKPEGLTSRRDGLGETDREGSEREDQNKSEGVRKTSLGEKDMMIELDKAKSTILKENRQRYTG